MKYIDLKEKIKQGADKIYLLQGEELYFKDKGVEQIKDAFLGEESLNYTTFQGSALKGNDINKLIESLQILPFMSEKRIVKVEGFYPTEKEYKNFLEKFFSSFPETSILIIVNEENTAKGLYNLKVCPFVTYVDCSKSDEDSVMRWIYLVLKKAGIMSDSTVCTAILKYCLCDMSRIVMEVKKIIAYKGGQGTLTMEEVDELVYKDAEYKIYEMSNAIAQKNFSKYTLIMSELQTKGYDALSVLNSLCSYFRNLSEVYTTRAKDSSIAKLLGTKEYAVKKLKEHALSLERGEATRIYIALSDAINSIKLGEITQSGALQIINAKIFSNLA